MTADAFDEDTVLSLRREPTLPAATFEGATMPSAPGTSTAAPVRATAAPPDTEDTVAPAALKSGAAQVNQRSTDAATVAGAADTDDTVRPSSVPSVQVDTDDTVARPSRAARARIAGDPAQPALDADALALAAALNALSVSSTAQHLAATIDSTDSPAPSTALSREPRHAAARNASETPVRAVPRVRLPDGTTVELDRRLIIGRKPALPRVPEVPAPRLVTLTSPAREISSSHLELRASGGAVVATDLHSSNGTVLLLPSGASRRLVAGDSAIISPGTLIVLGEGNALTVLGAAGGTTGSDASSAAGDNREERRDG